jgi:hypothetical protein
MPEAVRPIRMLAANGVPGRQAPGGILAWHSVCGLAPASKGGSGSKMAKQGQHHNDAVNPSKPRGHEKSRGHNHPDRSQRITTENYKKQIFENVDPHKRPPEKPFDPWNDDIRESPSIEGSTRARDSSIRSGRSGSDSNRSRRTRGH